MKLNYIHTKESAVVEMVDALKLMSAINTLTIVKANIKYNAYYVLPFNRYPLSVVTNINTVHLNLYMFIIISFYFVINITMW